MTIHLARGLELPQPRIRARHSNPPSRRCGKGPRPVPTPGAESESMFAPATRDPYWRSTRPSPARPARESAPGIVRCEPSCLRRAQAEEWSGRTRFSPGVNPGEHRAEEAVTVVDPHLPEFDVLPALDLGDEAAATARDGRDHALFRVEESPHRRDETL